MDGLRVDSLRMDGCLEGGCFGGGCLERVMVGMNVGMVGVGHVS